MAHSVPYSRGIQYARAEYRKADTPFKKMKVLTKLESDANSPKNKTLFEQGILAFVRSQRELNKNGFNWAL